MFEPSIFRKVRRNEPVQAGKDYLADVDKVILCTWEEHCVECAWPLCYDSCKMFQRRYDGRCIRVIDGLVRNYNYSGVLGYGMDCRFRKWGKVETSYSSVAMAPAQYRKISQRDASIEYTIGQMVRASGYFHSFLGLRNKYRKIKAERIATMPRTSATPDAFVIQCFLPEAESAQLLVQFDNYQGVIHYSKIHALQSGENNIVIPLGGVKGFAPGDHTRIFVTPLGEEQTRIVFTWLNPVILKSKATVPDAPASKIKCVAWDLDNTMWKGILSEDGLDALVINREAVDAVKELDRKGILNTICSKNDHQAAMEAVRKFGLEEYFLYPAINWGQKSQSLKTIAKQLNLGIDSFAFVDDNPRERAEVSSVLPCVRCYADTQIQELMSDPATDVPVTEESGKRRLSYMQEMQRQEFKESFSEDYDSFLRNLGMTLTRSRVGEGNFDRSLELLARTNQLNLRTVRYTADEFRQLLGKEGVSTFCFGCTDRFGDYGQVGVMTVMLDGTRATILDLVISCRVAGKKVEQAMIQSLNPFLAERGVVSLDADLCRTKRNKPIEMVFDSLPFIKTETDSEHVHYAMESIDALQESDIVKTEIYE